MDKQGEQKLCGRSQVAECSSITYYIYRVQLCFHWMFVHNGIIFVLMGLESLILAKWSGVVVDGVLWGVIVG